MSEALFRRVLGAGFETLPTTVKAIHLATGARSYRGQVQVTRGSNPLSRLVAWATRLPPAGEGALEVEIVATGRQERWTRHIGGRPMPSRLWEGDGLLCERLGLAEFGFRLSVRDGVLDWRVARVRVLGLPLPAAAFRAVLAHESESDGRYRFEVAATLPLAGLLVHYRGWLDVP